MDWWGVQFGSRTFPICISPANWNQFWSWINRKKKKHTLYYFYMILYDSCAYIVLIYLHTYYVFMVVCLFPIYVTASLWKLRVFDGRQIRSIPFGSLLASKASASGPFRAMAMGWVGWEKSSTKKGFFPNKTPWLVDITIIMISWFSQ